MEKMNNKLLSIITISLITILIYWLGYGVIFITGNYPFFWV